MLARAAKPKLSLALPTSTTSRGFSMLQQPTFAYAQSPSMKSILKKGTVARSTTSSKKLQFRDDPAIHCITPVPEDYHGTYVKMSRDERRWGRGI
ncbi:MAG: hypothetical protein LQ347_001268 [Umbilicaria vellea]|nr:MAG: hypothetical protein LQ347_001268 [Umbilicaria vellea]